MNRYFLKKICFIIVFILTYFIGFSQKNNYQLFDNVQPITSSLTTYVKKGFTVTLNKSIAKEIIVANQQSIELSIFFENKNWVLELEQSKVVTNNFFVTTALNPNSHFKYNDEVVHYKGFVKGNKKIPVAVSIMQENVLAVIADMVGNINVGAINTADAKLKNQHIIYRDSDLLIENEFACQESLIGSNNPIPSYELPTITTEATLNAEPVDIYFEADHSIYLNNSSNVNNVVNYVTSLINIVNFLFERDSVNTKISAIKVWDVSDPYVSLATSSAILTSFASNMSNGFPGDLAHFLTQRTIGGGIAYLDVLCASNYYKTGVSGNLSNSFNLFPTYSWSVMVVTHEIGHNLGSRHTQSCTWPGGAIDNCYTTEGGCPAGSAPVGGGTIMSYCHLTSYGTNLANGFGPLPGGRIRDRVRTSTCIFPSIYYETTSQNITEETADNINGCIKYKLISTKLKIPYAPTQPANITLVPTGTNGLEVGINKDLEISTNSFVLDANNLSQTINLKVYDDAVIEDMESLILNFNINPNGGNAKKSTINNIFFANIISEDHRPDSSINQLLFYESFDTITTGIGAWSQNVIHGATSPNRWIIKNTAGADFSSNAAYISNNNSSLAYSGASILDSTIVRLESPYINATGFTNLKLSFLYKCTIEASSANGGANGGGENYLDYGRVLYTIDNGLNWLPILNNVYRSNAKVITNVDIPVVAGNISNLKIAFEWRNNSSVVSMPAFIVDSIVIKGTSTTAIQTVTHPNNFEEAYFGPNETVHFYNPVTKNIIATIENLSSFDFGCTKVELVRTGNATTAGWGSLQADKISDKVFKISTENTSPNAPYKVNFYFTDAEINGWLAGTGNIISDMNIVKTYSNIGSGTLSLPPSFSSINLKSIYGYTQHSIIAAVFTGHEAITNYALMKPYGVFTCPSNDVNFATNIIGANYQWQVDDGAGYVNITNTSIYNNVATNSLSLIAPPTSYVGNKYRCVINTTLGIVYSQEYVLKYTMQWLGTISTSWEEPLNWSCNAVPNDKADVIVNTGTTFEPTINLNTTVRSITLNNGAQVNVKTGVNFVINH